MQTSTSGLSFLSKTIFTVFSLFISAFVFAQDGKSLDVNINTDNGGFFSNTWVWVVGVAVFILLLVALLRGGGRKSA